MDLPLDWIVFDLAEVIGIILLKDRNRAAMARRHESASGRPRTTLSYSLRSNPECYAERTLKILLNLSYFLSEMTERKRRHVGPKSYYDINTGQFKLAKSAILPGESIQE
jgi:hypothetical protein